LGTNVAERVQKVAVSGEPEFDSTIAVKLLTEAKVDGCDGRAPLEVIASGPAEGVAVNRIVESRLYGSVVERDHVKVGHARVRLAPRWSPIMGLIIAGFIIDRRVAGLRGVVVLWR
jgi:hypothetical protein